MKDTSPTGGEGTRLKWDMFSRAGCTCYTSARIYSAVAIQPDALFKYRTAAIVCAIYTRVYSLSKNVDVMHRPGAGRDRGRKRGGKKVRERAALDLVVSVRTHIN
jgi:hypothetical protein